MAEEIAAEHRRIHQVAAAIQSMTDLSQLLNRLAELRRVLAVHFSTEEAPDGFYDTMRAADPRHIGKLDQLMREHAAFLAEVDQVSERATRCLRNKMDILRDANALMRRLWDHETRENGLLLDTIYTDLGQGDG